MTPAEASARAYRRWARVHDRTAATQPARRGFDARFERQARELLGPDATERQIADSAESLRKAWLIEFAARGRAAQA